MEMAGTSRATPSNEYSTGRTTEKVRCRRRKKKDAWIYRGMIYIRSTEYRYGVRRLTSKVLASVLFISLAQYANTSTPPPSEISHLVENRCENETSDMKRLSAKGKRALIDIAIKR
jgi:hypothetical protein